MRLRVRVLDEAGKRSGYVTDTEAIEKVNSGQAKCLSDGCIRMLPTNPRVSSEDLCGRLRIKQSGRRGPVVVQVE
jgi:hypothetical protein